MAPSAKKKALRRSAASEPSLFDEDGSTVSDTTAMSCNEWGTDAGELDSNPFEAAIDELHEKRSATREHGLAALVALLTSQYCCEEACERQETIMQLLLGSLRKGGPGEATLAARGLALLAITLGSGEESAQLLRQALLPLIGTAKTGKATGARTLAADTLALLAFVGAEDFDMTCTIMGSLEQLRSSAAAGVQAAALRGWSLLLSTLPAWQLTAADIERQLASLAGLLQNLDVDVRAAAGEAVALLYHTYGLASLDAGGAEDSSPTSPREWDSGAEGAAGVSSPVAEAGGVQVTGLDEVVARMRELASNRGDALRRSKRDRGMLKNTFRDLLGVVEEGATPETRIKLRHGDTLVVDSLAGSVQLNALRTVLAGGFQAHLQANPLLHDLFGYTPQSEPAERLTRFEKRLYRSPNSAAAKQHTQQRKSHRADAAARKGGPLGDGDW